jgi:multiple sugar transport system substrate-binding protein
MRGRRSSSLSIAVLSTFALVAGVAGCGDDGGGGTQAQPGTFEGKGPITWATGKDTSGYIKSALDKWNADHADQQITLIELPGPPTHSGNS